MKKYLLIIFSVIALSFILAGCADKAVAGQAIFDERSNLGNIPIQQASSSWELECDEESGAWCNCQVDDDCEDISGSCVFRDTGNPNLGKMCAGIAIDTCPQNVNDLGQDLVAVKKTIPGGDNIFICDGLKNPQPPTLSKDTIVAKNGKTCVKDWWYMQSDEKTYDGPFNCEGVAGEEPWCATNTTNPGNFYVSGSKYGTSWARCDPTQKDIVTSESQEVVNTRGTDTRGTSSRGSNEPRDNYKWLLTNDPNTDTNNYADCEENSDCDSSLCVVKDPAHPEVGKMCAGTCTNGCPTGVNSLNQDLSCKKVFSGTDSIFYCFDLQ